MSLLTAKKKPQLNKRAYNEVIKEEETERVYAEITEKEYIKLKGYLARKNIKMKELIKEMIRNLPNG